MDTRSVNAAPILFADGNRATRRTLQQHLRQAGHSVTIVRDTTELRGAFEREKPALLLIESNLPGLPDSFALCTALKTAQPDVPLIMIVGADDYAVSRALTAGADDCLTRPVQPSLLLRRIDSLLSARPDFRAAEDSRRNREKYYYLFDAANDAIFIIDLLTGRFLDANRQAVRWLGHTVDELRSLRLEDIKVPQAKDHLSDEAVARELTTKGHFIFEQVYRNKQGQHLPVEVSTRVIDYDGRRAFLSFVRDIRARKMAEDAELQQRRLAEALRDTAAVINSTLKLSEVADRILEQVARVLPCDTASIMLVEDGHARVIAQRGYGDVPLESNQPAGGWPVDSTATFQWMTTHRKPIAIPNVGEYPGWVRRSPSEPLGAYVAAPILAEDRVIGFLNLDDREIGHFSAEILPNLMAFAHQAGIAIRNAQLYEAVQKHAGELEVRVARRTEDLVQANLVLKDEIVERQRVEAELAEERHLLRTLIDNLPDRIYVKDIEGRFAALNQSMMRSLAGRLAAESMIGATDHDWLPPDRAAFNQREEQEIMRAGQPVINREAMITRSDGAEHWELVTKVPLRDNTGHMIGLVGIHRDVTEIKRAEERVAHIIRGARCLLWFAIADDLTDRTHWQMYTPNEDAAQRFLPIDQPPGQSYVEAWWQAVIPDDRDYLRGYEVDMLREGVLSYQVEYRVRRADGTTRWLHEDVQVRLIASGRWNIVSVCTDITERKAAVEALRQANELLEQRVSERTAELSRINAALKESETRFRLLVEHAPEAIVVFDMATERFVNVNENAVRLYGLHRRDLLRHGFTDFAPRQQPDGLESVALLRRQINRAINGDTPVFEWLHRDAHGREVPCEVRLLLLPTSGSVLIRGSLTDITERKRAEDSEREARQFAEALRDTAAGLGETLEMTEVLDRILTFAVQVAAPHDAASVVLIEREIYVRAARTRVYLDDGPQTFPAYDRYFLETLPDLARMMQTGQPLLVTDASEPLDWIAAPVASPLRSYLGAPIFAEGRAIGFLLMRAGSPGRFSRRDAERLQAFANQAGMALQNARLYDAIRNNALTLRQRVAEATAQLEQERAQLRAILDAMTEGVVYYDDADRLRYINQSLARLTGYTEEEWLASDGQYMGLELDAHGRDHLRRAIFDGLRRFGMWRGEVRMRRKGSSETFEASLVTTSLTGVDGASAGAVTVIRDISQEKRLEAQKARFIATASHELRTPLANIKTRLYLMRRQPDKADSHLEVVEYVTDRMRELVEDLLDVSRFEHGIISLVHRPVVLQDLAEYVAQIQRSEADEKSIDMRVIGPGEPVVISGDASRLTQVITNLITNAINYTPVGGRVEVRVEAISEKAAALHVEDTGIGIPAEMLPHIFKPFFRASDFHGGTGLGLSIAREIVELHHGRIEVVSTEGKGTCFSVYLDRIPAAAPVYQPPFVSGE